MFAASAGFTRHRPKGSGGVAVNLDRWRLALYGTAHGGKSLFWHTAELLLGYVLTEAWRVPPHDAARILALTMTLSATLDIVVARTLSHGQLTASKAVHIQAWASLACGIAFIMFGASGLLHPHLREPAAILCISAFRIAYVFIDVPQNALLPLLTDGERERTLFTSTRYVTGGIAAVLVTGVLAPALMHDIASASRTFFVFAVAVSVTAIIGAFLLRTNLHSMGNNEPPTHELKPLTSTDSTPFGCVLIAMFAVSAGTSTFGRLEMYFVTYGSTANVTQLLLSIAAGGVLMQPLWLRLSSHYLLPRMLRIAAVSMLLATAGFHVAASTGGATLLIAGFVYGGSCAGVLMGLWALAAGAAARRAGGCEPAMNMALLTFSAKMGLAMSAIATGWLLHGVDYRSPASESVLQAMTYAAACGALASMTLSGARKSLRD